MITPPNKKTVQQPKDNESRELVPDFSDLSNPATILNHVEQLTKTNATPHAEILDRLLNEFQPLDFELLAFPQIEKLREKLEQLSQERDQYKDVKKELDKLKIKQKHLLILSVENVLQLAQENRWGICKNHDFIYLYNGTYWSELDKETFGKFLGEAAEKMGVPKFSARYYQFREQIFKQFLSTAYLPTPDNDIKKVLVNLQNGTFEVNPQGTQLRSFERSDFLTYQLPFDYDPKATAPIFEEYLNRVLPDIERQKVLAEYLGYVFVKHGSNRLKEEKALILYGGGSNGKSVFFEVVSALLGNENTSNFSLQSLTNENGYFRAKLANRLVNYASEINGKMESSIFKLMVSGEPIEARLPYGQPFVLRQYAKLIFNCNELPKDVEHTNAYFRRFLIIPFDVTIPEQEQDKNLHTKIIDKELSGVFNWVLDGLHRLLDQKHFTYCEAAKQAVEQYRTESDSVQMFVNENGYQKSENYTLLKDVYHEYKSYCLEDGYKPLGKKNFRKRLEGIGIIVDTISRNQLAVYMRNGERGF